MIQSYLVQGTEDIAYGLNTKAARQTLPRKLHSHAQEDLFALDLATSLGDLALPGYHLEALKGARTGRYSIRINRRYRICFRWDGTDAFEVEVVDYHGD